MDALPVTDQEFAQMMAPLGPYGPDDASSPVMLAVSGGADSMSLALLARRWRHHVRALVVDHALREESAEEARITCARLAQLNITSRILTLGPLRLGGVQERARDARFDVLEQACVEAGGSVLLVAHHEADQEETLMMRYQKQSGFLGMNGMARRSVRERIAVVRPLLGTRPERLRATLRHAGIEWCEDPSNQKRSYHRVRVRQDMTWTDRDTMRKAQGQAQNRQVELDQKIVRCLAVSAIWHPEGWVSLREETVLMEPDEVQDFLFARLIKLIGGQRYLPRLPAVRALRDQGGGTLGGASVRRVEGRGPRWLIMRECRGLEGAVPAQSGQWWDRRWRYIGPYQSSYFIAALGAKAGPNRVGRDVPALVLQTLPALWCGNDVVAVPEGVGGVRESLARCAFVWESGVPITGERSVS
ncbi:tRNA lysidine(34) synthetase TilS [Saccharibacter sp. 17.LH.SD]|uniref:tRNA lysidine(34) synthetase TilS n=1 Tax=Saccharibacter sp. 17.LH.SD TaxID=2689393 RepID=UPI00351BC853